jgi:putative spermidine/putrescine transport system ATP-binding protein
MEHNRGSSGASVRFTGVGKSYGSVDALIDFDLEVKAGEFVTLLGASGSGKTTALNGLAGFVDATAGDVKIGGQSVLNLPSERRNVGMVFQSYSLFPHMNVFENIAFPLRLRKMKAAEIRSRVEKALDMIQLSKLADRMPKELSGGQRQRVAFARAVVFEPPVLLMDEPLGALDLKLREAMQIEIKRYHRQLGCTIIFVTHDQGEALGLSDRVAVMDAGRIVQIDTPQVIYDQPKSKFVAQFIGKTNFLRIDTSSPKSIGLPDYAIWFDRAEGQQEWGKGCTHASLRPERLWRVTDSSPTGSVLNGKVEDVLFLGNVAHYSANFGNPDLLFFEEQLGKGVPLLDRGDPLKLGFASTDLRPVPNN